MPEQPIDMDNNAAISMPAMVAPPAPARRRFEMAEDLGAFPSLRDVLHRSNVAYVAT